MTYILYYDNNIISIYINNITIIIINQLYYTVIMYLQYVVFYYLFPCINNNYLIKVFYDVFNDIIPR